MSGSTLAGPTIIQSLAWLVIAVAIKCAAFGFLERRLTWSKAILFMLLANVLSTVLGVLTAGFAGAMSLLSLPVVFGLGKLVEHRLSTLPPQGRKRWFTGGGFASAFTVAYAVSVVMFYMASHALDISKFGYYWVFKILFATLAVSVGMAISAILEECAIARLARKVHGRLSFFTSVVRANYITLGLVLLVAALKVLPQRLRAPHFIVSWLQSLGLA